MKLCAGPVSLSKTRATCDRSSLCLDKAFLIEGASYPTSSEFHHVFHYFVRRQKTFFNSSLNQVSDEVEIFLGEDPEKNQELRLS